LVEGASTVEEDHRVVIGGARRGHLGDEALAVGAVHVAVHVEDLVGERHRAEERVPEGPICQRLPGAPRTAPRDGRSPGF
jgi:hypothetical protein